MRAYEFGIGSIPSLTVICDSGEWWLSSHDLLVRGPHTSDVSRSARRKYRDKLTRNDAEIRAAMNTRMKCH